MAAQALPKHTAFRTPVDYRFVTYSDHAGAINKVGLDGEKVIFFKHASSYMDTDRRMAINQGIAASNLHGLSALLKETAQRNYKNEVEELWAMVTREKPDLMVIDCLATSAIDLAHHLRLPFMLFYHTPILGLFGIEDALHLPDNLIGERKHELSLLTRIKRILGVPSLLMAFSPSSSILNTYRKEFGFVTYDDPAFIVREYPILVASVFGFEYARPTSPLVRLVGMMFNNDSSSVQPSTPSDHEVLEWMNAAKEVQDCVVFAHFGTEAVPSKSIIVTVIEGILAAQCRALVSVRQDVLAYLDMSTPNLHRSKGKKSLQDVMVVNWVSSRMVLDHSAVKAFICHGGAQSMAESVHSLVPLLMLPQGGDRYAITARVLDLHIGLALDHHTMSVEKVQKSLEYLLDPSHRDVIQAKMSWLIKINHYAGGGVRGSVQFIEEVLEGGYEHLRPLPVHPFSSGGMDALAVLVVVILSIVWICCRGLYLLLICFAPRSRVIDSSKEKTR
eukprot:gene33924-41056_t